MEFKRIIPKYSVLLYFALTFLVSWGAVMIIFGFDAIPATEESKIPIGLTILLGPTTASLLIIIAGKGKKGLGELLSRLSRWRLDFRWYLVAIFIAPISTILGVLIFSIFSENYHPAILISEAPKNLLLLGLVAGIIVGLFEELGWTGFATPRLLKKHSIFTTGIIIGALWGLWHFILFWEDESFSEYLPFLLLIAKLFTWLPAYRILMVRVFKATQSLLIIIIMHASLVCSLSTLDPTINGIELLIYILIRAAVLWTIVGFMAIIQSKARGKSFG